jgi:hypothetical protein
MAQSPERPTGAKRLRAVETVEKALLPLILTNTINKIKHGKIQKNRQPAGQFIPVIFDEQILPSTIEHVICDIIDHHLDLSVLDSRYRNDATGAPAILRR